MRASMEILRCCAEIGTPCILLKEPDASLYIKCVLERFTPVKTTGHLSIGHDSFSLPTDENEFSFSLKLREGPVRVFFDQKGPDRNTALHITNGRQLSQILANCFGMEYFISDPEATYLISVNWYKIEATEIAAIWLQQ
jgi:hypothetical protein